LPRTVQALPASPADLIRELDLPLIIKPRTFVDKETLGWRNVIIRSLADADTFYKENRVRFSQVDGRRFLAVLEEIGARLQSGDSFFAVLHGLLAALAAWPVGAYFAADDMLPGPFAVGRVGYRLASKAWRGQLSTVFTKQYDQGG
jgi:hypothetical protein